MESEKNGNGLLPEFKNIECGENAIQCFFFIIIPKRELWYNLQNMRYFVYK